MKNNKGFTLIELLAIVIILAIIMIIAAPSMTKEIKRSEKENENILNQKIENAAHIYAAKYYANKIVNLPSCSGDDCNIKFTLNDLEQDGLINLKDKCKEKNEKNRNTQKIKIENLESTINYNYDEIKELKDCYSSS